MDQKTETVREDEQPQQTKVSSKVVRRRGPKKTEFDTALKRLKEKFNANKPRRK